MYCIGSAVQSDHAGGNYLPPGASSYSQLEDLSDNCMYCLGSAVQSDHAGGNYLPPGDGS